MHLQYPRTYQKGFQKSISTNSKSAQIFNEARTPYPEALKENGYNTNLQFDCDVY